MLLRMMELRPVQWLASAQESAKLNCVLVLIPAIHAMLCVILIIMIVLTCRARFYVGEVLYFIYFSAIVILCGYFSIEGSGVEADPYILST